MQKTEFLPVRLQIGNSIMVIYQILTQIPADSSEMYRELPASPALLRLSRMAALVALAMVAIVGGALSAHAQDGQPPAVQPPTVQPSVAVAGPNSAEMREALGWLDRYLRAEVLFKKEDIEKIRKKVAAMSPEELQRWLSETAKIRAFLESDDWRKTREWLREFLKVQAIYSDEEVEKFRQKAANASPSELLEILMDIKHKHNNLRSMHSVSEKQRQSSMDTRQRYIKQQNTAQQAATRSSSYSSRPLFGNTQSASAARQSRDSRYQPPAPLITSREVSRAYVYRSVLGRHGGW